MGQKKSQLLIFNVETCRQHYSPCKRCLIRIVTFLTSFYKYIFYLTKRFLHIEKQLLYIGFYCLFHKESTNYLNIFYLLFKLYNRILYHYSVNGYTVI